MTTDSQPRRSIGAARNPDSHEAILAAAEDIFCEAGYAGFSIEAVARRGRVRAWPGLLAAAAAAAARAARCRRAEASPARRPAATTSAPASSCRDRFRKPAAAMVAHTR